MSPRLGKRPTEPQPSGGPQVGDPTSAGAGEPGRPDRDEASPAAMPDVPSRATPDGPPHVPSEPMPDGPPDVPSESMPDVPPDVPSGATPDMPPEEAPDVPRGEAPGASRREAQEATSGRLGRRPTTPTVTPGTRVVLDARPLQDPERGPTTAAYLDALLRAFAANPLAGESFTLLLRVGRADPSDGFPGLPIAARRRLPPTRLLRSGALTVDPFLLRGAQLGASWRADEAGASGTIYHAVGGAVPLASGLPIVATLLDLAPWELPDAYQRSTAARFGQRLRGRILRGAAAVIVPAEATARATRRLLHVPRERIHVVPLAARDEFAPIDDGGRAELARLEREHLGLPARYFVYSGRYDARHDLSTLLEALEALGEAGRPAGLPEDVPWPPLLLLVDASPDDRAEVARLAARHRVGELLRYAPRLDPLRLAVLVAGARAALLPARSESAGLPALEALASGTPVVASAVGALPEIVGPAGILVEPGDPRRLASALSAAWADDHVHRAMLAAAMDRALGSRRRWSDVARETRAVYATAAGADPVA